MKQGSHNYPGSTGDHENDMDGREDLVEHCLDRLFAAYDLGRGEGFSNPVIFLVDCEDAIGAVVARGWEGDEVVDAAILANADSAKNQQEVPTTVLIRAASFADSQREVPQWFPYLEEFFLRRPPNDTFCVVAIAFGGAATFTVPLSSRPT